VRAPSEPETAAEKTESLPGYDGLFAPSAPDARAMQEEPPGYAGVMQGYTEKKAVEATKRPGADRVETPRSADDIKTLSMAYGFDKNGDGIPDGLKKPEQVSARKAKNLSRPRPRRDGLLPREFAAQKKIDRLMKTVTDGKLTESQRRQNADKAYKELASLSSGLQAKKKIPDRIYRDMGLNDVYIQEKKEGVDGALIRVKHALKELRDY
jgi:hypothetical protein